MTILWIGGEDINFPFNTPSVSTTVATYNDTYARCTLNMINHATTAMSTPFPGGVITSGWLSSQFYQVAHNGGTRRNMGFGDSASGTKGIYWGHTITTDLYTIYLYDGATETALASEVATSFETSTLAKIDMQLISYGAAATINLYVNGALRVTYTGDVSISGVVGFDCVLLGPKANWNCQYSEIIVADSDTRALHLVTYVPEAAGDLNEWTGAYTDVDEISDATGDVIYTDTDSEDFQANLSATPAGDFAVRAFSVVVSACKSADASVGSLKLGIKSGGTIAVDAVADELSLAWATYVHIMQTNPVTTDPFTTDELDALQVDLQSVA